MGGSTILAVDDDPNNLRALRLDLEDAGYKVLMAADGVEAWKVLESRKSEIKAILLDRMMPNMDGMQFMEKLRGSSYASKPVIMQTAAAEKEQVVEGIKAGVYYYLTKPYEKDVMLSVVYAAVTDYGNYSELRSNLEQFNKKLHLVRESYFELKNIEEVEYLAIFLAQFFPSPENVVFGIAQMLINAIEHGNLGITYDEKTELNFSATWLEEVKRRQNLPENRNKVVLVKYKREPNRVSITITDEGKGFNWKDYLEISPERATHSHGRGIALSRIASFDKIEFHDPGNSVTCTVMLVDDF